ncbi:MAG TPA: type 1 glutamine amidotransferase domain-containing protein [Lysobacter sp.]|nr:type 1 glutamine amidotransferase domain-containing protein [Lysobacter sp.]
MMVLDGRAVAILATDGFEFSELAEPRRLLEEAGARVDVVSLEKRPIRGWKDADWHDAVEVEAVLAEVDPDDYDALVLPGGVINPDKLRQHPEAIEFVRRMATEGKPVAAICHGPWTLIDAGVVEGRRVTSWPSLRRDLENAGARWEDSPVVCDGNLITSRKPDDIELFAQALIDVLQQHPHAELDVSPVVTPTLQ